MGIKSVLILVSTEEYTELPIHYIAHLKRV